MYILCDYIKRWKYWLPAWLNRLGLPSRAANSLSTLWICSPPTSSLESCWLRLATSGSSVYLSCKPNHKIKSYTFRAVFNWVLKIICLLWFTLASKIHTPFSTITNRDLFSRVFLRLAPGIMSLLRVLIGPLCCLLLFWLVGLITHLLGFWFYNTRMKTALTLNFSWVGCGIWTWSVRLLLRRGSTTKQRLFNSGYLCHMLLNLPEVRIGKKLVDFFLQVYAHKLAKTRRDQYFPNTDLTLVQ